MKPLSRWTLLFFGVDIASACSGQTTSSSAPAAPTASQSTSSAPPEQTKTDHAGAHGSQGYAMDFSDVERFAKAFEGPERDAWQKPEEVIKLLDLEPNSIVADIGAGTGYFEGPLSLAVPSGRVIAIDIEPNMVAYMQRRAKEQGWKNVEARIVSPDDPALGANSVDRILIVNTWHHVSDRERYAQKLASSLRRGGAAVIVDFTADSDLGPPPEHRLAPERVVQELDAGGLRASVVDETLPKQYVVMGRKP